LTGSVAQKLCGSKGRLATVVDYDDLEFFSDLLVLQRLQASPQIRRPVTCGDHHGRGG
jgi:hypothetical protein